MLQWHNSDFSEGTDISKTDASKECDICHHWYFLNKNVEYEPYLCNDYHDLMERVINLNNLLLFSLKEMIIEFIFGIWAKTMQ